MTGRLVLIVFDDQEVNNNLSELIELIDFRHEAVIDAANAITRIRKSGPEIVLLDLQMPNASGLDILAEIR